MLKKEYILLFTSFLLLPFLSFAQQSIIEMTHYGMDEGLSHREAHVIFEDNEGFIWIGTKYGLNKFDGEEFKWYNQNKKGFSFNHISKITQDDEGWLWLWNDQNFIFFHPKSEEIQTLEERFGKNIPLTIDLEKSGSWKYWETRHVPKDKEGRLFLHSSKENSYLTYLPSEGFKNHHYPNLNSFKLNYINQEGNLFFNRGNVLLELDSNFKLVKEETKRQQDFIRNVNGIDGKTYAITERKALIEQNNQGIILSDNDIIIEYSYQLEFNPISKTLWLHNNKSWLVFDLDMNLITSIDADAKLPINIFNYEFVDSKGRVWLASDQGVALMELVEHPFSFYFNRNNHFPVNSSARGIWSDGKDIYANLEKGGFFKTDLEGNWELLDQSLENKGEQSGSQNIDYWGRSLIKDQNGVFWIGGKRNLRSYQADSKEIKYFYTKEYEDIHHDNEYIIDIWAIHEGKNNILWLGTGNGLSYKKQADEFISKIPPSTKFPEFSESVVIHIHQENDSLLYLSTNRGLYTFNTLQQEIEERFWLGGDETHFLPESDIQHIHKDEDGSYWLSSVSGLIHWEKEKKQYEVFNRRNGFPDNNIYGVLEDSHSNLWMGTDRGLVRFNKNNKSVRVYSSNDGLPYSEFNRISYAQSKDGKMFFGGMNGIIGFAPNQFAVKDTIISERTNQMQITEIMVFDEKSNQFIDISNEYWNNGKLVMDGNSSLFNINFTMLNYGKHQNNRYQYKIEGVNQNWININESNIQLNRLPYGPYELKIKGFDNGSSENGQRLNVTILVPPPFYLSWWFILSIIAGIAGMLSFIFWRKAVISRKRQEELKREIKKANQELAHKYELISEQKEQLQQANYTKNQIFAILGHDLRKPANAFRGIAKRVNYLIKKKDFDTLEQVSQSIEQDALGLNALTDNLLNWALTQRDSLPHHETSINLKNITTEVFFTLNILAKNKNIELISEIDEETFVLADRNSLLIIIRNLVDNAIKFTAEGGRISLSSKNFQTSTDLIIQDNGVGIPTDKIDRIFSLDNEKITKGTKGEKGTGLGLHLVQELVLRNNGKISLASRFGEGTSFHITLPSSS